MSIGLCTISNRELELNEVVEIASDVGFEGIELWGKPPHVKQKTSEEAKRISELVTRYDQEIMVYGSYLRAGDPNFDQTWEEHLDFGRQLGAEKIRIWAGEVEYADVEKRRWKRILDDVDFFATKAGEYNIEVTVERHYGSLTHETKGALRLMDAIDHPNCGLNWQPNPFLHETGAQILQDAEALAPVSNNIHVQSREEPHEDTDSGHAYLENAFYSWEEILSRFSEAGYRGNFMIEFTNPDYDYAESLQKDFEYLRDIIGSNFG